MRIFVGLCWTITILCAVFAALDFLTAHTDSAPQQCAVAAQALAIAVIPYIFTRAFDGIRFGEGRDKKDGNRTV